VPLPLPTDPAPPTGRLGAFFMFVANLLAILQLTGALNSLVAHLHNYIEADEAAKYILVVSLVLSNYGFRSALNAAPPTKG
jgi:hypothetical protein